MFDAFLRWLFDGIGLHMGAQNTYKIRPKGDRHQNLKLIEFASTSDTLATFKGAENQWCLLLFLNPVLGWLWEPILKILALLWGPFWKPFWLLFVFNSCIVFSWLSEVASDREECTKSSG